MALTYNWNEITESQTDVDSPVNELLMESIRQNLYHLEEWLGKDYTAAENHDHDDSNSARVADALYITDAYSYNHTGVGNGSTVYYDALTLQAEAAFLYTGWITNSAQTRIEHTLYHRYNGGSYYYGLKTYNTGAGSANFTVKMWRVKAKNYIT